VVPQRTVRFIALLLVTTLGISLAAYALMQKPHPVEPWKQTAESSIKMEERSDGFYVSTENQRFSFVEKNQAPGNPKWFVLKETFARVVRSDDTVNHAVTVNAWSWSAEERRAEKKWVVHEEGDEGDAGDLSMPLYKVTKFGCCGERTVYSYFAFDSGNKMYRSSFELAEAFVLNAYPAKQRFVSYDDSMGNGKALLAYGSRDHLICQISVEGVGSIHETETKSFFQYKGKQIDSPLELDDTAGQAGETSPFNFVVSLRYSDGFQINLAIRNDDVDLASSTIPDRFKVSKVNLR
jgi:hypothetical protein